MKKTLVLLLLACGAPPVPCPALLPMDSGVSPPAPDRIVDVQVGETGFCTRSQAGVVECTGAPADFTLVDGGATQLSVAGTFVYHEELLGCVLLGGGQIECASSLQRYTLDVPDAQAVTVGDTLACARTGGGDVWCWAALGGQPKPAQVPGVSGATQVAAGFSFACAIVTDGAVKCWGYGVNGELDVPAGVRAVQIAAGGYHACGLGPQGELFCWGRGHASPADEPVTAIGCGFATTCWLNASGRASCASDDGTRTIPPLPPLETLSAGGYGVCGLDATGNVACASQ
jgi:hypothetical protein